MPNSSTRTSALPSSALPQPLRRSQPPTPEDSDEHHAEPAGDDTAAQPASTRPDDLGVRLSDADRAQPDVGQLARDHGPGPAHLRPGDGRRADRHLRPDAAPAPRPGTSAVAPGPPLD